MKDTYTAEEFKSLIERKKIKPTKKGYIIVGDDEPQYENMFIVTEQLITLNEYINIERTNRFGASSVKKKYTDICANAAMQMKPLPEGLYDVEIVWNVLNNRQDADNVYFSCKFLFDGAKNAGRIKDDNRKNIRHISHRIYTRDVYSVEVRFIKV